MTTEPLYLILEAFRAWKQPEGFHRYISFDIDGRQGRVTIVDGQNVYTEVVDWWDDAELALKAAGIHEVLASLSRQAETVTFSRN